MRTLLATLAATMVVALPLAAQRGEDFRWSGALAQGKEIEVAGVVGDIRAVPSTGSRVEVVAQMPDGQVPVRVVEHEDGVTLCVVYPSSDGRVRSNEGRCNNGGNTYNPPRVDFTVRVPAGVRFSGRTVTGDVEARGLGGPVRAFSVSGGVDVEAVEVVRASSVSGNVRVAMARLPRDGQMRFSSVSGDIRLTLPSDASAALRINTLSGEVDSEFPLQVSARGTRNGSWASGGQRIQATIGRGGAELRIHTVSGDIEIDRGR